MKNRTLLLLLIVNVAFTFAQTDTTFYNSAWQPCEKQQAAYYRLPIIQSDEGFLLRDFFITGEKQFEGYSTSPESDIYQGTASWFYKNGTVEQIANYENGIKQGEFIYFNEQGEILAKGIYEQDAPYHGSFYEVSEYIIQISTYENGELKSAVSYDPNPESKARVIVTVTDNEMQNGEFEYYNQNGELLGKLAIIENTPTEGIVVDYSYNPMLVKATYIVKEGIVQSPAKYFYSNGTLKKLSFFETDYSYPNLEVYYDLKGDIIDTLILEEGIPQDGTKIDFFESSFSSLLDCVEKISEYKGGMLNGISKTFYENGALRMETRYTEGYETGDKISFDTLGNQMYVLSYRDGMPWSGTYTEGVDVITYTDGVISGEQRYYSSGKIMTKLIDGLETAYDTAGNVLATLHYKNGMPHEGKKLSIYYDQVYSEDIYSGGVKIKTNSFGEGVISSSTEYNSEGIQTKDIYYYTTGKVKKEVYYTTDGAESSHKYYDPNGKPMGSLTFGKYGFQTGDRYEFDGDLIVSHVLYKDETALRTSTYDNGVLISDISQNGKSVFYDRANNKTYVCSYKDGEPFSGTIFDYDSDYHGITKLESYKNGKPEGESVEYTFVYTDENYSEGKLMPEYVYWYNNGLKQGPAKQYFKEKLIKSMNYSNDLLEGEYITYDLDGNILSSVVYSEGYPFNGFVCDYDYNYQQILSLTNYLQGNLHGEQKYFSNGTLQRLEIYDNGIIQKETSYLMGFAYELSYINSEAFEGKKIDTYNYFITEYSEGRLVSTKTYASYDFSVLTSVEIYNGNTSTKTSYYLNGAKKEETEYQESVRNGKAVFYNSDGTEIASGIFESDLPISGIFAFFSKENESDYLILEIENNNFRITEIVGGKQGRMQQYNNPAIDNTNKSEEIQKFISMVQLLFENFEILETNSWY